MEESWRWFGPADVVTLHAIRQAGARGVVTALHDMPYGEVWTRGGDRGAAAAIAADGSLGLRWNVVESLPVHERIKLGEGDLRPLFDAYRESMRNLAAAGCGLFATISCRWWIGRGPSCRICCPGAAGRCGSMRHDSRRSIGSCLGGTGRRRIISAEVLGRARDWFGLASERDKGALLASIMAGLPGAFDRYDLQALRGMLAAIAGGCGDGCGRG